MLFARQLVQMDGCRAGMSLVEPGIGQLSFHLVVASGTGNDEASSFVDYGTAKLPGLSSQRGERWREGVMVLL